MNKDIKYKKDLNNFYRPSQEGASVVEFAIVFPLLLLLIFGMIEFGLYMFNRQVMTNACREAVRYGIVSRNPRWTNSEIQNELLNYAEQHLVTFGNDKLELGDVEIKDIDNVMSDGFDPDVNRCTSFEVTYDDDGTETQYRCELEVNVDYEYEFLLLSLILNKMNIHGMAKMRME